MPSLRGPVRPAAPLAIALHIRKVMRIAQVAPLYESVPPRLYGGTERVVSFLTEELVRRGHEVTLFASGDSRTGARWWRRWRRALRLDPARRDQLAPHVVELAQAFERAARVRRHPLPHRLPGVPVLAPGRPPRPCTPCTAGSTCPTRARCCGHFDDVPLVSITDAQRGRCRTRAGLGRHGVPRPAARRLSGRGPGAAATWRSSAASRPRSGRDLAIAAPRVGPGCRCKIAAKVDAVDRDYFEQEIEPLLADPLVEFVGEIGDAEKAAFLGDGGGAALPDRLAGAVRPGDDRGAGLRHAGDRAAAAARCPR